MTIQTTGSVTIEIGEAGDVRKFVLDGTVGNQIQVGFRASDGDAEIALGTFESIIGSVAQALGAGDGFVTTFKAKLDELEKIDPLAPVVNQLRNAALFVTDLAFSADYNETEKKYVVTNAAFGFRVEFSELKLGPVQVTGFGVLFEYTPTEGDGQLTAGPA